MCTRWASSIAAFLTLIAATAQAVRADLPPTTAPAGPAAATVLASIDALPLPALDSVRAKTDQKYLNQYRQNQLDVMGQRAPLIQEFARLAPDAPALNTLLPERWRYLRETGQAKRMVDEITAYLATHPDSPIRPSAALMRVLAELSQIGGDAAFRRAAVAAFEKDSPQDKRLPSVLKQAGDHAANRAEKQTYVDRLTKEFPGNRTSLLAVGQLHAEDSVGKPFELSFDDAISGKKVSIADLKGKVVVLDFWATWCGPCVAEMPHMKQIYAQFKGQGVEFIGVSLDEPDSVDKVKTFAAKNEIGWPQYYMGKGWDSDFSVAWGISAIPAMFVIDADGRLVDIAARGKLETLLPQLLKKPAPEALKQ